MREFLIVFNSLLGIFCGFGGCVGVWEIGFLLKII